MKKTIAVLFGGPSTEHEISIITGVQAFEHIDTTLYEPIAVYVDKHNQLWTGRRISTMAAYKNISSVIANSTATTIVKKSDGVYLQTKRLIGYKYTKIDIIHPCFHGGAGEGGSYQGWFDTLNIAYTGNSTLSSAITIDKQIMKQIFAQHDIPMVDYLACHQAEFLHNQASVIAHIAATLQFPMFVKPNTSGSSIGISKVANQAELADALEVAFLYDTLVLVEKSFENAREFNISVMPNTDGSLATSAIEEVFTQNNLLDFDSKYKGNGKKMGTKSSIASKGMANAQRQIPADISAGLHTTLTDTALKIFKACKCSGLVRIDFLANADINQVVAIEINSIPGSLSFYLWQPLGLSYADLQTKLFNVAEHNHRNNQPDLHVWQTDILNHL